MAARPLALVWLPVLVALVAGCGSAGEVGTATEAPAAVDGGLTAAVPDGVDGGEPLDGGFPPAEPARRGGELRLALSRDPLCWSGVADDPASLALFAFAARGLYAAEPTAGSGWLPVPDLAADLPLVSEDGLIHAVRLRDGLRFPDGSPVTAADVEATFGLLLDPAAQCGDGGPLDAGAFAGLVGVRAVDGLTVEFELAAPNGAFPLELAAPWAFIRPRGADPTSSAPPAFVGPYRFAERDEGEPLRLEREPGWAANVDAGVPEEPGENAVDGAVLEVGVPAERQVAALVAGDLDLSLDPDVPSARTAEQLRATGAVAGRLYSTPTLTLDYGLLRADVPPFDDPTLRQAVNHALDREALGDLVGGSLGADGWSALLPGDLLAGEASDLYPPDPALARREIAAAGRPAGPLVLVHPDDDRARRLAVAVRRQLADVGLRVRLRAIDPAIYEGFLVSPDAPFHLALAAWSPPIPDASAILAPLLACEAPRNAGRWCEPGFDAALGDLAAATPGPERATRLARLATETAVASAPWWTIAQRRHLSLVGPRVANYRWTPIAGPELGRVALRDG